MDLSVAKKRVRKLGQTILALAVIICVGFALISTHQLNQSIDKGNRRIVLNYGNQVAARLHDSFERVDISLAALSRDVQSFGDIGDEALWEGLRGFEDIWSMDASGFLLEDGTSLLSDGSSLVFENKVSLLDVLSYSEKLNISRQTVGGADMLVFTKPCQITVDGRPTSGIFAAIDLERLESFLGEYGYGGDSLLALTRQNGDNIWKQSGGWEEETGNCFADLEKLELSENDSVLQMQTRMTVTMDGTVSYTREGQVYYMAYVPLDVNYWYLLVSAPSDSIDLTELSRRHFVISALLVAVIVVMGGVSIIYLRQRNRSISRYNKQLEVATVMAHQANEARQANKAKQEFLAKVSHDIRTPLNGVMGMITLAKEEYADPEKCAECLDKATVSAHYLLELLNDVLDMSQIESGKLVLADETVDMKALLAEVETILETSAKEKGLSFEMDEAALIHRFFKGDNLRIKQILTNLSSNAVKYTPSGGHIRLEAAESEREEETWVTFRVEDTGEGIAEEDLETIFKPFEQASARRQGGVGLGLSIVRSFVEHMGGSITVESKLGAGSSFTVTLPLEIVEQADLEAPQERGRNLNGVCILLAEDNELNAEIAVSLLRNRGAQLTLARDGIETVAKFRDNPPGTYDVVLMDIQMPKMDGLEATREIRNTDRPDAAEIPILAMTANAFHEQKDEMAEAGMNDFLYKPIDIEAVCLCIRKWIRED